MKKLIAVLLTLIMVMGLVACGETKPADTTAAPADTTAAPEENTAAPADTTAAAVDATEGADAAFTTITEGKLTMSTNAAFPPYEMLTEDGTGFEGIDVEIATAIAQKLGLELEILDMDFDAALLAVNQGKADIVMSGVTINEERKIVMEFTESYTTAKQVIIVKEGSDVSIDNLGEKQIGTQRGTTGYIYSSDDYGEDHVVAYDTGMTAVQALLNGQVDCVIIDSAPAEEFAKTNPGLTILETEYAVESYGIGCDKGNTALVAAINEALTEMLNDGTVQAIIDKYIAA